MADLEKVIKGLECCNNDKCDICPYYRSCDENDLDTCRATLHRDALVLLKAQEPRVLTLEEIKKRKELSCWLEWRYGDFYAALLHVTDTKVDYVKLWTVCAFLQSEYGITVRCWSTKPSEKQIEAVKWNG